MGFLTLALVCLVALLGPLFSLPRWLRVPVVVGELLVGIVLGRTGLGVLHATDPTFSFMAQLGFAMVMFVAGTHVPVRDAAMRRGLARGLLRAVAVGVLAVPAGLGIARLFGTGHGLMYAVLLASSSASLVMPSLEGVTVSSRAGLEMLPQLAVADAACIVALPLAMQPSRAGRAGLGALAVMVAAAGAWLVLRWLVGDGRQRRVHRLSEDRHLAIELRVVLVLLFGLAGLAGALHVSIMLAGFLTGLAVAAVGEPRRVANQMFALTEGLFAPLFFVWLGSSLDLRQLASHPSAILLGLCLGVAALVVHGAMRLTGQPLPVAMATAAELGVPVGAATLGTELRLFVPGEATALLLGAMVTIAAVAVLSGPLQRAVVAAAADAREANGAPQQEDGTAAAPTAR